MRKSVPNQRFIKVLKKPCDKNNKYTTNNLQALDQAAKLLQSKAGFKLYMYIAKNQSNYSFFLSSSDFMKWSGVAYTAYSTAFNQLVQKGYLVQQRDSDTKYTFFDYSISHTINKNQNDLINNNSSKQQEDKKSAAAATITYKPRIAYKNLGNGILKPAASFTNNQDDFEW